MTETLTISQMAERCGLSAHTLRYYERIGLVQAVARSTSGHRRYSPQDIDWIAFINRMKATGMSIQKMQEFAELRRKGERSISQRRALLERHNEQVQAHIRELEAALSTLHDKVAYYRECESAMTSPTTATTAKGSQHGKPKSLHTRSAKAERN
jgi:DNA-binding transcriptional MerR regulator